MTIEFSVLLADDHEIFRREVRKLVEEMPELIIAGEVGDGPALFAHLEKSLPSLVILDISMPYLQAMEATRRIKIHYPEVKVLILIMDRAPEYLIQAAAAGAEGCLLKQDTGANLGAAIDTIRRGGKYLLPMV